MAKRRPPAKPPETAPDDAEVKKNLVVIRGYVSWGKWLEAFAESERSEIVPLIDRLLSEEAKRKGFRPPPKRY